MMERVDVRVIIPALNEEKSIAQVLGDIPRELVNEIIVIDNGSTDSTSTVAASHGATVLIEMERGYGAACLKGIDYLIESGYKSGIVVFLDGDYSDYPGEMPDLIAPILNGESKMVIGSRTLGNRQKGSMTFPQRFGNWLATWLINIFFKYKFTDLGPFRAIDFESLMSMKMRDRNYGWTVEMQLKAANLKLPSREVAVSYRNRIGKSKVSGTVRGTIMAGYKILWTIFKHM